MLRLHKLAVGYPAPRGVVLQNMSIEAAAGSFICVLGRNGAGKSTLMRTLAGLQPALAGTASLGGDEIANLTAAERARRIAVVLTERIASPGLTVNDVVCFGRLPFTGWRGTLAESDRLQVRQALAQVQATVFDGRLFDDLSDGERQRVMIARAIAQQPALMVLDEITAFLDLPGRVEVMALLRTHARKSGTVVLLSSHDLDLSLQLADQVWLVDRGGTLQVGTPAGLVQSGAIGRAFDTDDVAFSTELGRFELRVAG